MNIRMIEKKELRVLKADEYDWIPAKRCGRHVPLNSDEMYINVRKAVNDGGKGRFDVTIYFGKDVADLMNLVGGSRVELFLDRKNPNVVKLKKTNEGGLAISKNVGSDAYRTVFRSHNGMNLREVKTTSIRFDLFNDDSVVLNLSQFGKVGQADA